MTKLRWNICLGVLVTVVLGRTVINEYDLVGEEGLQGQAWTITDNYDNTQTIIQVSEMSSDSSSRYDNFGSYRSDMMRQAMVEFAWISQQFEVLADLEQRMMSSCQQMMMDNMQTPNFAAAAPNSDQVTPPSYSQDTDALFKYMSQNRFQPFAVAIVEPFQFSSDSSQFYDWELQYYSPPDDFYLGFVEAEYPFDSQMQDNRLVSTWDDKMLAFYDTDFYYGYDDDYQLEEEDQVQCFMLSLFLALACSLIFLAVFASFQQLAKTISMSREKQLRKDGVYEEDSSLKTSLLTPLKPEPATGVVIARDHVENSDGGRFVEVVYVPIRGD